MNSASELNFSMIQARFFGRWHDHLMTGGKNQISVKRALEQFAFDLPENLVRLLIDDLKKRYFVDVNSSGALQLTSEGIRHLEEELRVLNRDLAPDSWNESGARVGISAKNIEHAKVLIAKAIVIISQTELSQSEKSQISGLLSICDQILDLPTPKLNILKRLLSLLRSVKDIKNIVELLQEIVK